MNMCGINGITRKDEALVLRMNAQTKHRGPDGAGVFSCESVTLGHNLLAITDRPDASRQPFVSTDKQYAMVFNGEIYNYHALRKELQMGGGSFVTDSDTEVLFKGLQRYGPEYLKRLDGMFALAFLDVAKGTLLLARDQGGMKPLYYTTEGGTLTFSSELRGLFASGISRVLDIASAKLFFALGYVPGEHTLLRNVLKIRPGEYLLWDISLHMGTRKWFGFERKTLNKEERERSLREIIGESVGAHTMGLRPFGLFLSGGLDSTVILHELVQRERSLINTYTTRFATSDPLYNEDADLAKRLTKDYAIAHHELVVTERDFISALEPSVATLEEPRYNHSFPAYWLLAQKAAKDIVVVLDGSGGDELFHGYPRYLVADEVLKKYSRYPKFIVDQAMSHRARARGFLAPWRTAEFSDPLTLWSYVNAIAPTAKTKALLFANGFGVDEVAKYLRCDAEAVLRSPLGDTGSVVAELDRLFWLADEDYLRMDKIAMHFGMEGRFPFLAKDVVNYANKVGSKEKLAGGLKSLVREAYQGQLPEYILNKKKTGWNAPVAEWLSGELGGVVREILSSQYYPETATLFDFDILRREAMEKEHYDLRDLKRILPYVYFQVWARTFNIRIS